MEEVVDATKAEEPPAEQEPAAAEEKKEEKEDNYEDDDLEKEMKESAKAVEGKQPIKPNGKLTLTAVEAKLTRDLDTFGKQDPFVEMSVPQLSWEWKCKADDGAGKDPKWNKTADPI